MSNEYFDEFYNNVLVPLAGFFSNMPSVVKTSVGAIVAFTLAGVAFKILRRVMQ